MKDHEDQLPRGFGRMPKLPKLPPFLAEIFSKPIDPLETLPPELTEKPSKRILKKGKE